MSTDSRCALGAEETRNMEHAAKQKSTDTFKQVEFLAGRPTDA